MDTCRVYVYIVVQWDLRDPGRDRKTTQLKQGQRVVRELFQYTSATTMNPSDHSECEL